MIAAGRRVKVMPQLKVEQGTLCRATKASNFAKFVESNTVETVFR